MQLLNSQSQQIEKSASKQLLDAVNDIADNIQIESNFTITHPNYQPLELEEEIVNSLQKLPKNIQQRYLNLQLRNFLCGIYFNGDLKTFLEKDTNLDTAPSSENLENNTRRGLNRDFYEGLDSSNCGKGYYDFDWEVVQESDGSLAVKKNDLTLHIERDFRYLHPDHQSAKIGDIVAIFMPHNLIEQGLYIAVGDAGLPNSCEEETVKTVNIYFNFTSEGASFIMKSLTQQLNAIKIPFSFKVTYDPDDYQRWDCGILNIEHSNYQAIAQVLEAVYTENNSYFRSEVPLFTKFIAPGISVAEELDCKFTTKENFGINRCRIIANALLEAWEKGNHAKQERISLILQHLSQSNIDLQYPYLNANSKDIYYTLDLSK